MYLPITHLYLCKVHWWYGPCESQSAMPSWPLTPHADIVMPDCSLLVTTFSRQTGPLQRMATRVTSMVTFIDEEYPVDSTKRSIKDARHLLMRYEKSSRRFAREIPGHRLRVATRHRSADHLNAACACRA